MSTHHLITCRMVLAAAILSLPAVSARSQEFEFKGQASSWGTAMRVHDVWSDTFGARYIPQCNYTYAADDADILNAEAMVNVWSPLT